MKTIFEKVNVIAERMKEVERLTNTLIFDNGRLCTVRTKNGSIKLHVHVGDDASEPPLLIDSCDIEAKIAAGHYLLDFLRDWNKYAESLHQKADAALESSRMDSDVPL